MMEERYHATTQNRFYPDMSNVNKNITVEAKLISLPSILYYIILYCIVLYYIILYYIILYYIILYYIVLYYNIYYYI